jgi:hypothetical protein
VLEETCSGFGALNSKTLEIVGLRWSTMVLCPALTPTLSSFVFQKRLPGILPFQGATTPMLHQITTHTCYLPMSADLHMSQQSNVPASALAVDCQRPSGLVGASGVLRRSAATSITVSD